jgi:capsular exopolysaccharide synthesis family protein
MPVLPSRQSTLPPTPSQYEESQDVNLLVAGWLILRRHKLTIVACGIAAVLIGLLVLRQITPRYQTTASIRVDPRQDLPVLDALKGNANNNLGTEMQMLRTRSLAQEVVDSLGLRLQLVEPTRTRRSAIFAALQVAPDARSGRWVLARRTDGSFALRDESSQAVLASGIRPGAAVSVEGSSFVLAPSAVDFERVTFRVVGAQSAVSAVTGSVSVGRRTRDADIMDVRLEGTDPELLRDVTNALVTRFITERQAGRQAASLGTAAFVQDQLVKVGAKLKASEERLRRFRESERVVSAPDQASTNVRRASDLEAQRDALLAERVALDRLLQPDHGSASAQSTSDAASSFRELAAFPSLLRNQAVGSLLNSLTQIEDKRAELLSRRKPGDSEVIVLTNRATQIEQELRSIALGYRKGLNNQAAAIDDILARSNATMRGIPGKEMRYAQLEREVRGLEQIYQQLQLRLKESEIAGASQDPSVRLLDLAVVPTSPAKPRRGMILLFAGFAGVAVGVAAALARELADGSVRTRADAQSVLGVPVLGIVPSLAPARGTVLATYDRVRALSNGARQRETRKVLSSIKEAERVGIAADAYERVHSNLLFALAQGPQRVVMFTSALPRDGKTTTAANFAITLARRGLRVIVVDGDLRRGRVHTVFHGPRAPGLAEVLAGSSTVAQCVRTVEVDGANRLDYIASGEYPSSPTQLLDSDRTTQLLRLLADRYDRVILDSPPLNVVTDAALLGARVDTVVMVARAHVTPADALAYAGEQARGAHLPLAGIVLNDIDLERDAVYDQAYRWYKYGTQYYAAGATAR